MKLTRADHGKATTLAPAGPPALPAPGVTCLIRAKRRAFRMALRPNSGNGLFNPLWPNLISTLAQFEIDEIQDRRQNYRMGQAERPTCPHCGAFLILALPPGGKGQRTFQCFDCDRPDPLKTDQVRGWFKGELQPPK